MSKDEKKQIDQDFITGIWSERILVITKDYEIKGNVFMPKTGRRNRVLSDILNGGKRFVAIKDCEIKHREFPNRKVENHDFLQLNLGSIILLRPLDDEEE
ncbi:MAG: hypothetical protein PHV37_07940 [Candidatus Gastranaerophilales bacterium]|nr:hypothetical protein [Candidatus Gastranaerophilales bacterium]